MALAYEGDEIILRFLGCNFNVTASEDVLTWLQGAYYGCTI
jgi:hypothetical protein